MNTLSNLLYVKCPKYRCHTMSRYPIPNSAQIINHHTAAASDSDLQNDCHESLIAYLIGGTGQTGNLRGLTGLFLRATTFSINSSFLVGHPR